MDKLLVPLGRLAGSAGIALCAVAAVTRLSGQYFLAGVPAVTLLQGGMAAMIAGCFLLLVAKR
jgi:hypothetical protein